MESATDKNINQKISNPGKIVVMFYADWCPFCRRFKPNFESYDGKVKARLIEAKVDDDDNPMWDLFNIKIIPTVVAFKDGKQTARKDGKAGIGLSEPDLKALLKEIGA
jgi:thioredoxin 1